MNAIALCPCGSDQEYDSCCGAYHSAAETPPTAEKLMRSRYSAFVKGETDYLFETTWPARRKNLTPDNYNDRAENSIWLGLQIHDTEDGSEVDTGGTVTFTAKAMINGQVMEQKEKSLFKKKGGRWFYVKPIG